MNKLGFDLCWKSKRNHIPYQKAFGLKKARPSSLLYASKEAISNSSVAPI